MLAFYYLGYVSSLPAEEGLAGRGSLGAFFIRRLWRLLKWDLEYVTPQLVCGSGS